MVMVTLANIIGWGRGEPATMAMNVRATAHRHRPRARPCDSCYFSQGDTVALTTEGQRMSRSFALVASGVGFSSRSLRALARSPPSRTAVVPARAAAARQARAAAAARRARAAARRDSEGAPRSSTARPGDGSVAGDFDGGTVIPGKTGAASTEERRSGADGGVAYDQTERRTRGAASCRSATRSYRRLLAAKTPSSMGAQSYRP